MMQPTRANLEKHHHPERPIRFCSGAPGPSGNPRHFKHLWQVLTADSPWEGDAFFEHAPLLCGAELQREIERVHQAGQGCMIYGQRRPRRDPANPWDLDSPRWRDAIFAPPYDEDTDPVYCEGPGQEGHK